MTIDFQQIYSQLRQIGESAAVRKKTLEERRALALRLLKTYAADLDALRWKVESARAADASLRCALPLDEALDAHPAPPAAALSGVILAADGSQIVPSRHKAIQYSLINVGVIALQLASGQAPEIFIESDLRYDDEADPPTESQIALRRDLAERRKLLEVAGRYPGEKISLTDGQLELWGAGDDGEARREFEKSLQDYLRALQEFRQQEIISAGYIDKPAASWLIRLLEVLTLIPQELPGLRDQRPLRGVSDVWLMGRLLGAGERSAVFAFQARSAEKYSGDIALHFFYINVGSARHPAIARVDIPRWVAQSPARLNQLHLALLAQSRLMGARPFPYILHRAHEIAVVSQQESAQVDQLLELTLRQNDGEVGEISGKQSAKNLPGRG
ncbi:MAG: DNA double-strand break repair nuclease NurA [Anaerolineales bacterium]